MKNVFVVLMNILFLLVVAADVVAVKYDCDATPVVKTSAYAERQAQYHPVSQTADMMATVTYSL